MLEIALKKSFGQFSLDVALTVRNEIMVLLAPSGGGKTLTLNLICGMIPPDSGYVKLNGQTLYDSANGVSARIRERNIGYIYQDYALFPNKTVFENIAFGISDKGKRKNATNALLDMFNLRQKAHDYPGSLSGGQQQRVAIARAIASEPKALLFDEPLSALDTHLRERLLHEIRHTAKNYNLPVVYVTHNFREAMAIGDRVAVMNAGRLIEEGPVDDIFLRPKRIFTARFIGIQNLFQCADMQRDAEAWRLRIFDKFDISIAAQQNNVSGTRDMWMGIYATDVRLVVSEEPRPNELKARIESMSLLDRMYRIVMQVMDGNKPVDDFILKMDIGELTCEKYRLQLGGRVRVSLRPDRIFLCD